VGECCNKQLNKQEHKNERKQKTFIAQRQFNVHEFLARDVDHVHDIIDTVICITI
jgi:hypothetical protein